MPGEYNAIQWMMFFYIYCFIGWCFESAYVSCRKRHLVNRGFMRGPFLPLYGSGAIMMLVVSMPFRDNILLTFIAGMIGATLLEYVTGMGMEALFKIRYWDYANQKFNLKGYICLSSSITWGAMTILMTLVIHKPIEDVILAVPMSVLSVVVLVLTTVIVVDLTIAFRTALDLKNVLVSMEKGKAELMRIQKRLDVIAAVLDDAKDGMVEEFVQKKEAFMENLDSYGALKKSNLEELTGNIEEQMNRLKNAISEKPAEYVAGIREELAEIRGKYAASFEEKKRFRVNRDFHKRNLILGNPTMKSTKYNDMLNELKKELKKEITERRLKKDDNKDRDNASGGEDKGSPRL